MRIAFLLSLGILALVLACSEDSPTAESNLPVETLSVTNDAGGNVKIKAELTCTNDDRALGLMLRTSMAEDRGMLFFMAPGRFGFWMKNTLIPLTAIFINADGVIVHMEDMQPQTMDIHNTTVPYYYGLEVNQGWPGRHDIAIGDTVRFPWPSNPPPGSPPSCEAT